MRLHRSVPLITGGYGALWLPGYPPLNVTQKIDGVHFQPQGMVPAMSKTLV